MTNGKSCLNEKIDSKNTIPITRHCADCGKPVVRFRIVKDKEKACTFVQLELKCKSDGCFSDSSITIRI